VIYDVNCEQCRGKKTFNKQTTIKQIPPYFFIHLRRLVFDYQMPNTKKKVHSQLKFPEMLLINKEKLSLKAVITHSGSGEHGHYIASVK
jgi:ubiquitin C-terminal hydrolase